MFENQRSKRITFEESRQDALNTIETCFKNDLPYFIIALNNKEGEVKNIVGGFDLQMLIVLLQEMINRFHESIVSNTFPFPQHLYDRLIKIQKDYSNDLDALYKEMHRMAKQETINYGGLQ